MKIAHVVVITPNGCGLYETTMDTVIGLRELGHDARLVDPDPESNPVKFDGEHDRNVPVADIAWAHDADVIVSHSGIGNHFRDAKKIVSVLHGRPYVSYLSERNGGLPLYSYYCGLNDDPRYKAFITYWPQHVPYIQVLVPDKPVYQVASSVDLKYWRPFESDYDFGGHAGAVNVVIADGWREDVDPFLAINAFALWSRNVAGAKLHIYDIKSNQPGVWGILNRLAKSGNLGECLPRVGTDVLREVYNSANFVLTPHVIDVRTVREAMACGCPVVRVGENLRLNEPSYGRSEVRQQAMQAFDRRRTAKQFEAVLETLL